MKEETELKKLIKRKESDICLRRVQCVYLQKVLGWKSRSFYLIGSGGRIRENMTIEEEAELIEEFRNKDLDQK